MPWSAETLAPLLSELDALRRRIVLRGGPALRLRLSLRGRQRRAQDELVLLVNVTLWSPDQYDSISVKVTSGQVIPFDEQVSFDGDASALPRILDAMLDLNLCSVEACSEAGLVQRRDGTWRAVRLGPGAPFHVEMDGKWVDLARGARILDDGARVAVAYAEDVMPTLSAHERLELETWREAFQAYASDRLDQHWCLWRKIEVARNGDLGYVIVTDFVNSEILAVASLEGASLSTRTTT